MGSFLEYAIGYEKLGCFVLPIHSKKKKPVVEWAHRKDQRPTRDEINQWWKKWAPARVGIATGDLSGFDVVDLDNPQAIARVEALCGGNLPETISQTTGRGLHLLFKYNGNGLRNVAGKGENKGIDLRTDGGFIVVAPSPHKNGRCYQWTKINPLVDGLDDLSEMPPELIEHFKKKNGGSKENKKITLEPVERGARNDTLARLAGKWINQGMDIETAYFTAIGWNNSLPDPLDEKEVRTTVESIFKTHERNHPDSQIDDEIEEDRHITGNENSLEFPTQIMTGAAGYFADVYGSCIEAPQHFLFMSYLTCLGSILSPKLALNSVLRTQPRLFTIIMGESATERKSTTLNQAINHFKSVLDNDFNVCWGVGSAEGLQKVLKGKEEFSNTPVGTLLSYDELKAFVSKCNIDSSVLLPIVNQLFEQNIYESHTKKRDIEIDDAHLSMLAATTIATYEKIYNSSFLDIGFPNRVFLVPGTAKRQHSIPPTISEADSNQMKENLVRVLQHVGDGIELDLTEEAKALYHEWYMTMETSIHAKRLDTYSLRFMMLLAVNNLKEVIDAETVRDAISLCDWQLDVRKLHDPIEADTKSAKMEQSIRKILGNGPVKDWELKQKTGANRMGLWFYDMAIKNLEKANEIGFDKQTKRWFLRNEQIF